MVGLGIPAVLLWKSEKKKDKLKQVLLFKKSGWIRAADVNYSTLDARRDMQEEQNPSYQQDIKESIQQILNERKITENENHILLIGPSLSGKSHITISILKNLRDAYVLIPDENTFNNSSKDGFEFPAMPKDAQYKIVLLDNFHEFFKGDTASPNALIHKAIEDGLHFGPIAFLLMNTQELEIRLVAT
ncbi:MAG: ATP-binding protein [Bacteroidetes bacterium]|nr:ATP-binding protein [Bacteroidota bacterium]